jgi:hypothetical protein
VAVFSHARRDQGKLGDVFHYRNGLHPYRYLEFLLTVLPGADDDDLESLLPWSEALPEYCRAPGKDEEVANATQKPHKADV